jgi:ABC-type transporter Mla maintaining outer membrane lipid asymmetry ATPase subunit MlaF
MEQTPSSENGFHKFTTMRGTCWVLRERRVGISIQRQRDKLLFKKCLQKAELTCYFSKLKVLFVKVWQYSRMNVNENIVVVLNQYCKTTSSECLSSCFVDAKV